MRLCSPKLLDFSWLVFGDPTNNPTTRAKCLPVVGTPEPHVCARRQKCSSVALNRKRPDPFYHPKGADRTNRVRRDLLRGQ